MRRDIQGPQVEKDRRALAEDALIQALKNNTPAQVEAWVESNVNNLAEAKVLLKTMAKVVAWLARRELRDL